jgi:hypothetical protein
MEIICHIIGIININKNKFISDMNKLNYHIIDLDELSSKILSSNNMLNMFKQYQGFKDSKNDKYKETEKKMNSYWENSMEELIEDNIDKNKKNIIIGNTHHFRNVNKRINITNKPMAKFIIKISKSDVKNIIKYNLEKHKNEIINGSYQLNNIDFDYIYNNRIKIDSIYEKNGYLPKSLETIYTILNLSSKDIESDSLWIAKKQPYNVSSKIHPYKNEKIFAFTDKALALLSSFNFEDDELEKTFDNNVLKIKPKKEGVLDKLNDKRYLYLIEKKNFVPHEKGNNVKFFSQDPATIIDVIKINNVYKEYFNNEL